MSNPIACGFRRHHRRFPDYFAPSAHHHHLSVLDVRLCGMTEVGVPSLEEISLYAEEEAQCLAEQEAEMRAERWYEDGGVHADQIRDEDRYEQQMEANDPGLQWLRAQRGA